MFTKQVSDGAGGFTTEPVFTSSSILSEATNWADNFNGVLLVIVGVGIGFACVRFAKNLFF